MTRSKWIVVYDDKTEFEGEYKDIDRNRIKQFKLFHDWGVFVLDILPGQSLIYRIRHTVKLDGTNAQMFIVGYRADNKFVLTYIYPDRIELGDERGNIELLDIEK